MDGVIGMKTMTIRILAAFALITGGLFAFASPAAASSTPQCTRSYTYYGSGYWEQYPAGWNSTYSVWSQGCWLSYGSSNAGVKQLQSDINNCYTRTDWGGVNLGIARLTVDGSYGAKTKAAVIAVQKYERSHGNPYLAVDGVYGPNTAYTMDHTGAWSGVGYRCWHYKEPVLQ
ncbi:MAG: peptidoglycan-binding protein [Catenulispora sp.]|nr:peptidoglycan-binding protein [Catenulispora sp.]NUT40041.1 peptidoglycan-binding protein [Thermoactinospora sp.]